MGEPLLSVGIDVGTSTTQVIFSRLTVENRANDYTVPDLAITGREILYRSPVSFTPLVSETELDAPGIRDLVLQAYGDAGVAPKDVATGAIIITGETARKENARVVLDALDDFAGEFVVATAGPDLESVLAAKGAGAADYSRETGKTLLHMDIGGGTSNLALIENGEITQTGCLNVGGRLIRVEAGRVTYVSPVLRGLCDLRPGCPGDEASLRPVISLLEEALCTAAGLRRGPVPESLLTNRLIDLPPEPVTLSFSGGVAALLANPPEASFPYGDIGVLLARAIRAGQLWDCAHILSPEAIRATVIGAGCHSTQLSGSTVFARQLSFPLQNLPVLALSAGEQSLSPEALARRMGELAGRWEEGPAAVFLPGLPNPTFRELEALAEGLLPGLRRLPEPHVVVTREDQAKALGAMLGTRLPGPLLCLDSLSLTGETLLDVSPPVSGGLAYPVVKKTLVLG